MARLALNSERYGFLKKTAMVGDCWKWLGPTERGGMRYGLVHRNGATLRAHRVSYAMFVGPIMSGFVLHSCDRPLCVNPEHLRSGTQRENCMDAMARDRHSRGERNGNSKLTDDDICDIRRNRANGVTLRELADWYGMTESGISMIARRKNWRHVV